MLNKDFIKRKIDFIQNDLVKLAGFAKLSFDEVSSDPIKQAAVERFLERIINRAIDINQHILAQCAEVAIEPPIDYRDTFLRLADSKVFSKEFSERIAQSVGTRNILVHEYDKTDQQKIYSSIADCLKEYTEYCGYILEFLEK